MPSYSLTTTPQAVVATPNVWQFVHSAGTANAFLDVGGGRVEVLRPGGSISLLASSVSARTTSGTATLDVADYDPVDGRDVADGGGA